MVAFVRGFGYSLPIESGDHFFGGETVRAIIVLVLSGMLSGCSVLDIFFSCPDCALTPEDALFIETDPQGLLAFGLTVETTLETGDTLQGAIEWLAEDKRGVSVQDVSFPNDLQPGEHRLVVWRVPAGSWSLRNARFGGGRRAKLSAVLLQKSAATVVRPGRVTLAGEIKIQLTPAGVAMSQESDTGFIRQEMQSYANIAAPIDELPLADQRMTEPANKRPRSH